MVRVGSGSSNARRREPCSSRRTARRRCEEDPRTVKVIRHACARCLQHRGDAFASACRVCAPTPLTACHQRACCHRPAGETTMPLRRLLAVRPARILGAMVSETCGSTHVRSFRVGAARLGRQPAQAFGSRPRTPGSCTKTEPASGWRSSAAAAGRVGRSSRKKRVKARAAARTPRWSAGRPAAAPRGRRSPVRPVWHLKRDPEEALGVDREPVRHRTGQLDLEQGPAIGDLTIGAVDVEHIHATGAAVGVVHR